MEKTLAMKLLEKRKVAYETAEYPTTERDAEQIATIFGIAPDLVYKTLVVAHGVPKPLLVMLPANRQLDLKKLAAAVNSKKVKMATHSEAEQLTGLQVGGISPLALIGKPFVVWADQSIRDRQVVYISSGRRGLNLKLPAKSLLKLTRARVADLSLPAKEPQ